MTAMNQTHETMKHAPAKCARIIRRLQLLAPTGRLRSLEQPITNPPDVDDVAVVLSDAQLLPEARGMGFQSPCAPERTESPDLAEELFLREDAIRLDWRGV